MKWRMLGKMTGILTILGAACAHAPASGDAHALKMEPVFVTGSHLRQRADVVTGGLPSMSPMRVYSREELWETGRQGDLQSALKSLDPSLH
jgi:hypothetical protein